MTVNKLLSGLSTYFTGHLHCAFTALSPPPASRPAALWLPLPPLLVCAGGLGWEGREGRGQAAPPFPDDMGGLLSARATRCPALSLFPPSLCCYFISPSAHPFPAPFHFPSPHPLPRSPPKLINPDTTSLSPSHFTSQAAIQLTLRAPLRPFPQSRCDRWGL